MLSHQFQNSEEQVMNLVKKVLAWKLDWENVQRQSAEKWRGIQQARSKAGRELNQKDDVQLKKKIKEDCVKLAMIDTQRWVINELLAPGTLDAVCLYLESSIAEFGSFSEKLSELFRELAFTPLQIVPAIFFNDEMQITCQLYTVEWLFSEIDYFKYCHFLTPFRHHPEVISLEAIEQILATGHLEFIELVRRYSNCLQRDLFDEGMGLLGLHAIELQVDAGESSNDESVNPEIAEDNQIAVNGEVGMTLFALGASTLFDLPERSYAESQVIDKADQNNMSL